MSRKTEDFGAEFYHPILDWIRTEVTIDDVYDIDDIKEFVSENINVQGVYSDRNIIDYVNATLTVDEVFDQDKLDDWALANGYVKEI